MAAKPIIDSQLSVNGIDDEDSYVGAMENAGYVLRVREPGHRMLRTRGPDVQIHVCDAGSESERPATVDRRRPMVVRVGPRSSMVRAYSSMWPRFGGEHPEVALGAPGEELAEVVG